MKRVGIALVTVAVVLLVSCKREAPAGNATHGKELAARYSCNICHAVPGIDGPHGTLGPSLAGFASRPTISNGTAKNTPENLMRFLQEPGSVNPRSSMPPLGVTPADAQDLATFLQTLH